MATLIIQGIPPYDGEFPLDINNFTNRELHQIKQDTGLRAGEFPDALKAGDNDLVVAITIISLRRAGVQVDPDVIWDADSGSITVDTRDDEEKEDAERPLATPTAGGEKSENAVVGSESGNGHTSGSPSVDVGGLSQSLLSPTGELGSEVPAT